MAIWSNNGGNGKTQKHQTVQIELAIRSSNESDDFVLDELRKINTKMEMMIGCFNRMLHDRGKELDHSFKGGSCELRGVGIGELGRGSENRNLQGEFDSQCEGSSMEASQQSLVVELNINGDSEASRQNTNNKFEILEAKNLVNRSQIGDEDPNIAGFHGAIRKPVVQLSDFEANGLKINTKHTNFGEYMAVVEMEDIVVETEVILVDQELENASKGIKCGAANGINGTEVGACDSFVDSNRNGDVAGDKHTHEVFCANGSATGKMDIQISGVESYNGGFIPNIGLFEVQLIHEEFEDPFYDLSNLVQNSKFQLMLVVGIALSLVEINCCLVVGSMVCMEVMRFQPKSVAGIGVQWWRRGVG